MTIIPKNRPQKIDAPDGNGKLVLLPAEEYDALMRAAEDLEDLRAAHAAIAATSEAGECVPAYVAHRIAEGHLPLRVWREHRGLKAIELARAAGLSAAYVSEIETGKKDGSFRAMAALARVLDVSLDDLAPVNDEDSKREREQTARINALRDQTRALAHLVTGHGDFNTAAMRRIATQLSADAVALKAEDANREGWLDDILGGLRNVLELLDATESDIIEKAWQSRRQLAAIVASPAFGSERVELAEPLPEPPPMPKPYE
jgi:transcriptional regulator with XRE-family HTH domain